jgi:hypothetical protein
VVSAWVGQESGEGVGDGDPDGDLVFVLAVQALDVSRHTVRRAMAVFRKEGLVFTVAQRGTYVGPLLGA